MSEQQKLDKEQSVVAYFPDFEETVSALSYAVAIARMLNKPLMLLHIVQPKSSAEELLSAEKKIKEIETQLQGFELPIKTCLLQGVPHKLIEKSEALQEVVCVVSYVNSKDKKSPARLSLLLKTFSNARMAYVLVQEPLLQPFLPKNVSITVDAEKESKEKVIWASYFGRFNNANIQVFYTLFKDEFLATRLHNNLQFIKSMFANVGVEYQLCELPKSSRNLDERTLHQANTEWLLAIPGKDNFIQTILGKSSNRHLFIQERKTPVLFLNPRKDIYILCD